MTLSARKRGLTLMGREATTGLHAQVVVFVSTTIRQSGRVLVFGVWQACRLGWKERASPVLR
jgi:hypothetical protein